MSGATDPSYGDQWALPVIGWEDVHGVTTPGGTSSIAVLDTGVDANAPDLAGRVVGGWSFDGSNPASDPNGHGTHEATIAAGGADDGTGIAGVAFAGVTVMPVRVLSDDGTGQDSDIIEGLMYAVDNGAGVVLMAFSNPGQSAALQAAIDYAWQHGVVVVAAAGNDGSSAPMYPAGLAQVVGVGATAQGDTVASFSNQSGAVFITAPGVGIAASDASGTTQRRRHIGRRGHPRRVGRTLLRANDPGAGPATIVGRLARNTDPATGGASGNGRVNLARAIADTSTAGVTPAGVSSGGGPVVGPFTEPYVAAVAFTWTGATSTQWNLAANWSQSGDADGIPDADDTLTIGNTTNKPVITNAAGSVNTITINSGGSLTMAAGGSLTTLGDTTVLAGATLFLNGGTMTFGNGSGDDLLVSGTVVVNGGATANGSMTQTFTLNAGALLQIVSGTFPNLDAFAANATSTVEYSGAAAQTVSGQTYGHLVFTGAGVKTLGANANTTGDLTIATGATLSITNGTLEVGQDDDTAAETVSISGTLDLAGGNLGHGVTRQTLALNAGAVLRISNNSSAFPNFASDNAGTADDDVYSINATSTVQYTEPGAQTIAGATFNTIFNGTYGNLLVSGTGSKTLTTGNVAVQGDLTVTSSTPGTVASSILDIGGSAINRTAAGGTLTVDAGAALRIGGTTNVFPTNYSTVDLDPTSTVEYYGTGAQSVVVRPYGHLTVTGGNTKTAAGALIVSGNFLINTGTTFAAGASAHEFRGNFTNTGGTFSPSTGSAVFNGAAAQTIGGTANPITFGNVTIAKDPGVVVTLAQNISLTGNLTISGGTLNLAAFTANRTAAGGTLALAGGALLRMGGTVTPFPTNYATVSLDPASTVEYFGSGAQPIAGQTYGNLTLSTVGVKSAVAGIIVAGNFLISAGTFNAASFTHRFAGNYTNSGTFTATTSTVIFNGTGAQTVTGVTTFNNLTVNNTAVSQPGISLASNVTVTAALAFTAGVVSTGAQKVTVGAAGTVTGAGAATGHISGNLEKSVAVGNLPAIVFEVGGPTVAEYTPATVDIDGTTGVVGTLTVSEANGLLTGSDLNPLKIVTRSWRLLPSAANVLGTRTYKLTVDFLAGDAAGMNTALFEMRRKDSNGTWSTPTAGAYTRTATSTQYSNLTTFGTASSQFIVGEGADAGGPTTSAVTATPSPTNVAPTVTATVSDVSSGGSNVTAAEYFIDVVGANGTGTAMAASDTLFDSALENVTGTLTGGQFTALSQGSHTIFVHGRDANNNWGAAASTTFVKDTLAPALPTALATSPASPANDNAPKVTGTSDAGSTVDDLHGRRLRQPGRGHRLGRQLRLPRPDGRGR